MRLTTDQVKQGIPYGPNNPHRSKSLYERHVFT